MFRSILVLLLVAGFSRAPAAGDSAVSRLNPELLPLYRQLMTQQHVDLVGKQLALQLRLKHASDRFLLFADTQVVIDSNTSYYLIQWLYDAGDITGLVGKQDIPCRVRGTIVEVITNANPPRMPYLVVKLQSISP